MPSNQTATRRRAPQQQQDQGPPPAKLADSKTAPSHAPASRPARPRPPEPKSWEPDGAAGPPVILLEGEPKSGRSWKAAEFTGDDRLSMAYWLELGEVRAREYIEVPGARYKVLDHDGTYPDILRRVIEVYDMAVWAQEMGEKPVALVIDQIGALWDLLTDWINERAKRSTSGRKALERDPDAEIKAAPNLWTDGNGRHATFMRYLKMMPGPVVMISRGRETIVVGPGGAPVPNKADYRVEGNKSLPSDATMHIRMKLGERSQLISMISVRNGIRSDIDGPQDLPKNWTLAQVIFDKLKYDPQASPGRTEVTLRPDQSPEEIYANLQAPDITVERAMELWTLIFTSGYGSIILPVGDRDQDVQMAVAAGRLVFPLWDEDIRARIAAAPSKKAARSLWASHIAPAIRSGLCADGYARGALTTLVEERLPHLPDETPRPAEPATMSEEESALAHGDPS